MWVLDLRRHRLTFYHLTVRGKQKGTYRPVDDQYTEAEGGAVISPQDAPRAARKAEAEQADAWYRAITGEVFG